MKSISLFTGAGGLDLGLEVVGFKPAICVEIDADSLGTINLNRPHWKLMVPGDIHLNSPEEILHKARLRRKEASLLVGGPPCQPYSKAAMWVNGKVPGTLDRRSKTINAFMQVAEVALPNVILLENVIGLSSPAQYSPMRILENKLRKINRKEGTNYRWSIIRLNAVNYGVPQLRERIYLLAEKNGLVFNRPLQTHSILQNDSGLEHAVTAWEAIGDLDNKEYPDSLKPSGRWADLLPSIPEGANYLWHTSRGGGEPLFGWRTKYWSFLLKLSKNKPSWTLSANPGPATGPFHWRNRLLSIRELCRLQTFPDGYSLKGTYSSIRRQIGNAVPPLVGEVIGREIVRQLFNRRTSRQSRFLPLRFIGVPEPNSLRKVPKKYMCLIGKHKPHPGVGLGPRAKLRPTSTLETD